MFQILEFTYARLASITARVEKHGDDDKPAVSLKLEIEAPNTLLDVIDPKIRHALYEAVDSQEPLPGVEPSTQAAALPQDVRDFLQSVAGQPKSKPDYWSSCGQCESNQSKAEDLLAASPPRAVEPLTDELISAAPALLRFACNVRDSVATGSALHIEACAVIAEVMAGNGVA